MAEEQFFQMFLSRLRESISRLSPLSFNSSPFKASYLSKWYPYDETCEPDGAVAACDGSISESSFSEGLVVWVARSVAHVYLKEGEPISLLEAGVEAGYRLQGRELFLRTLELRTLRRALEKASQLHGRVFGIFDGSLYLTFLHHRDRLRAFSRVFENYVRELTLLLKLVDEEKMALGVSKDSDISYLRAKIMIDILHSMDPEIAAEARGRSIRRIREVLGEKVKGLPPGSMLKTCFEELEQDFSDEGVYSEIAPSPGFTKPLLLAPQTIFLTGEAKSTSWWDSGFRARLKRDEELKGVLEALDDYFSNPPVALTYWMPSMGSKVYRVDVPSSILGYTGAGGSLSGDFFIGDSGVEKAKKIFCVLNRLQKEPHVVHPLAEVDSIARLSRSIYKDAYEPVVVEELRRRGFKASPRRRSIRDAVLRGY
ncbi:MAG: DNA double-strand break repair nuclease NurA [Candidatus Brockarchaeota archaeon]|nr:DNA double-strand break repair nuclease NurA [Candidatus Brockarchaeota archaeon]